MVLSLFGAQWVFPETIKEVIISWKDSFVGKKRKRIWRSIPLFIFWTVWKERNRLAFRGGELAIQKIKYSFVYNMWGWAKLYNGAESRSLIGFLEWIASSWGLVGFIVFWSFVVRHSLPHILLVCFAAVAFANICVFTYQKKKHYIRISKQKQKKMWTSGAISGRESPWKEGTWINN